MTPIRKIIHSSFCLSIIVSGSWEGVVVVNAAYGASFLSSASSRGTSQITPMATATATVSSSPPSFFRTFRIHENREIVESNSVVLPTLTTTTTRRRYRTLEQAQSTHGMPWSSSIDPSYKGEALLYMKFWEWQTQFMQENLTDLKILDCSNGKMDFEYNENVQKKSRIVSLCLSSAEYRKIRLTYYDAGDSTQVFNAVFYPNSMYNLPILGIDILAFNRKKYLAIVDFQPLHVNEADHASLYEHLLKPIKDRYEHLKGRMSSKFYDETNFFSQQMLFSRFEDEAIIEKELFPAFKQYVQAHLQLIHETPADSANVNFVLQCQKAYDEYSAERDPATVFFATMFGNEWASDFVHDFLFSLSKKPIDVDALQSSSS